MAAIRKRRWEYPKGSGKFSEAWALSYTDADGKRRQEQFNSKKAADNRRLEIERELFMGVHTVKSQTVTVAEALDAWLMDCQRRHGLKDRMTGCTLHLYTDLVERYVRPALGGIRLNKLTPERCQDWIDDLASKYKAVPVHAGKVLNLALTFAVKKKWLKRSPLRDQPMRVPRHHAEIRIPTIHDLRALLEATETRARYEPVHAFENRRAFIKLAIYTGMRRGETAALRWEHINFVDGIVEVRHSRSMYDGLKLPKNEERGVGDVPMARELYEALRVTTYSRVGAAFFAYRCHSVASTETACFRHFAWWRGWSMRQYMRQKTKNETEVVD